MRLTPIPTPTISGPRNGGSISFAPVLGRGPQGLPGPGSAAWVAGEAVTTGAVRQAPDGSYIKATASRTTRPSFDATEQGFWTSVGSDPTTFDGKALSASIAQGIAPTTATAVAAKQGLPFVPCQHVSTDTITVGETVPIGVVNGVLYGREGAVLKSATSEDGPWTTVETFSGSESVTGIYATGDGEVLVSQRASGVWRSTGWASNPVTATWTKVLTTNAPVEQFSMRVDENSGQCAVTTYISGGDMSLSRYIWGSADRGLTWGVKYDKLAAYPTVTASTSHMHHCSPDPYWDGALGQAAPDGDAANPRWWAVWHKTSSDPTDVSDPKRIVMFTDNFTAATPTWTEYTTTDHHGVVAMATPAGMVMDTDYGPVGLFLVSRAATAGAMTRTILHRIRTTTATVETAWGWAMKGLHGDNGEVYFAFRSAEANLPATIVATDGIRADSVLTVNPATTSDMVDVVSFARYNGRLLMGNIQTVSAASTVVVSRADEPARGTVAPEDNGVAGGSAMDASVAVGKGSSTTNFRGTAVGHAATAGRDAVAAGQAATAATTGTSVGAQTSTGADAVAVGKGAAAAASNATALGGSSTAASNGVAVGKSAATTATRGTAVGYSASAGQDTVVIGPSVVVGGSNAVVIGATASGASNSTAVGYGATITSTLGTAVGKGSNSGASSTSVGESASASGSNAVAVGQASVAPSSGTAVGQGATVVGSGGSVALGKAATANHVDSVAIGNATTTTATLQVKVGARHIELTETTDPAAPSADSLRLAAVDNATTTQTDLIARFVGTKGRVPLASSAGVHVWPSYTTANRPTAANAGVGGACFDTTLGKPIWSDGTNWKDATGTTV